MWPGVWTASTFQPSPCDHVAVVELDVGRERKIARLLRLLVARRPGMRAVGIDLGAGRLGERGRRRHVIDMGVGDQDVRHRLAAHGAQHGVDMVLLVGAGIDDRHLAVADDVGAGALEGEGTGIVGDDAADQRRHFHRRAVVELEVLDEGNAGHETLLRRGRASACRARCGCRS